MKGPPAGSCLAASLLSVLFLFAAVVSSATLTPFNLNLVHTSFLDGRVTELTPLDDFRSGSFARIRTFLDSQIASSGANNTILLNSYNFLGTDIFFQEYKNTTKLQQYANRTGFQFMGLGTGELFYGPAALTTFLTNGNFVMLCSNVDIRTNHPLYNLIKKTYIHSAWIDGQLRKIGFIGFTDEALCSRTSCDLVIQPKPFSATIPSLIASLKSQGVDLIVAVSGAGFASDSAIAANYNDIDIIVSNIYNMTVAGGNYPTIINSPSGKPVHLIATLGTSKNIGSLKVSVNNGTVTPTGGNQYALYACSNDASPLPNCTVQNAALLADISADDAVLAVALNRTVGVLSLSALSIDPICKQDECIIGNLVTDAIRWRMSGACDIAFINGGSVRVGLPSGNITMRSIFQSFPFSNNIASFILTGADLIDVFQYSVELAGDDLVGKSKSGRFLQASGANLVVDPKLPAGQKLVRLRVENRFKLMQDVDPNQLYYVCGNNFLRSGGDGYSMIQTRAVQADDNGPPLTTTLAEYFSQYSPITPSIEDRIMLANDTGLAPLIGSTCSFSQVLSSMTLNYTDPCSRSNATRTKTSISLILRPPNRLADNATIQFFSIKIPQISLTSGDSLTILRETGPTIATYRVNGVETPASFNEQTTLPTAPIVITGSSATIKLLSNNALLPSAQGGPMGLDVQYEASYSCPPGTVLNASSICAPCGLGQYSIVGDAACRACPNGTFSSVAGSATCTPCTSGSYQPLTNQSSCLPCSGGRFTPNAFTCTCPAGLVFSGQTCVGLKARSDSVQSIFYAVNTFFIIICLAFWVYLIRRRNLKVFRSASPLFLQLALVGTILALIGVYIAFWTPSASICTAYNWFVHMGFIVAFGALYLKTNRISAILHVKDAAPVKLSDAMLALRLFVLAACMLVYLIVWTVIGEPTTELVVTSSEYFYICKDTWWNNGLLIAELVFILFGVYLAFRVRKAPSAFNEARLIGFSVYNWLALSVVLNIVRLTTPKTLDGVAALQCLVVFLTFFVTVCVLFTPKIYMAVIGKGNAVQWNTMGSTAKAQRIAQNVDQPNKASTDSTTKKDSIAGGNNLDIPIDVLRKNSIVAQAMAKAEIMEEEVEKLQRQLRIADERNKSLEAQVKSLGGVVEKVDASSHGREQSYGMAIDRSESEMA